MLTFFAWTIRTSFASNTTARTVRSFDESNSSSCSWPLCPYFWGLGVARPFRYV